MALTKKVFDRLTRQFQDATPEQLGEALEAAKHVLTGSDADAKAESALIKEFIESQFSKDAVKAPGKVKVTAKGFVTVDGVQYSAGQSGEITEKQYSALSRHFTVVKLIIALCCLGLALGASAQQYNPTVINGWAGTSNNCITNVAGISGTNLITATKLKNFGYQLSFKMTAATATNIITWWDWSGDGTNYQTNIAGNVNVLANGTSTATYFLPFTNAIAGYYRFNVFNSNNVPMSNVMMLKIDPGVKGL